MVLAEKQICRSVKQNGEPRDKHTYVDNQFAKKEANNTQWRKDGLLKKWCQENRTATYKRMKLDSYTMYKN